MNVERLRLLADHVETLEHAKGARTDHLEHRETTPFPEVRLFNMNWYFGMAYADLDEYYDDAGHHPCRSSACLAGWTCLLWPPDGPRDRGAKEYAQEALDLTLQEATVLFTPNAEFPGPLSQLTFITPADAARACRALADGNPPLTIWDHVEFAGVSE